MGLSENVVMIPNLNCHFVGNMDFSPKDFGGSLFSDKAPNGDSGDLN